MLERDQLNLLADKFEARFADVNRRILEDIGRTLKKTGDLTPSQARKLQQMYNYGADLDSMTRQLARAAGMSLEDIEAFYTQTAQEGYDWYRPFYEAKGMKQIPFAENAVLQGIVKSAAKVTAGELRNMSRTTTVGVKGTQGFQSLGSWYRKTVDDAVTAVATGTKDYNSAIRQAVKDLGNSGLRVEYESGYTRRLDSAVRQNVLDGVRYISQETARQAGEKFSADGVELDAHAPCAPDHLPYQGRQFSNQEYERLQRSLPRPIGEWNCGHFAHPILLGISKPAYSAAELAEMERYSTEKIEIDGKEYTRYECGQLQRQLETKMRYAREEKALYKTVGDKELERAAAEKLRVLGNKYTEVSRKAGLPTKMERTKIIAKAAENRIIEVADIQIGKSLGSAAFRDTVLLPDGGYGKIVEGSKITKVVVFAGKGAKKPVRVAEHLSRQYGGDVDGWQHTRGEGIIETNGKQRKAELHWFENKDVGRIKMKVKRWLDEG